MTPLKLLGELLCAMYLITVAMHLWEEATQVQACKAEAHWAAMRALLPPALPPGGASAGQVEAHREEMRAPEKRFRELEMERRALGIERPGGPWV